VRHLFSRDDAGLLAQLASSRVLLAFDFDGTLAPIVADRDAAAVRPGTAAALRALSGLYPCAVISGRGRADVSARLAGAGVKYVIGNHGLEPGADLPEYEQEVVDARRLLELALADEVGVDLEDKRYSLAVHYRRARRKRLARASILRAVGALPRPMRVVAGKLVVNVVPAGAPNKGDALLELRARERADTAIYLGDDVTDEDVFRLDQPGRLVSVRVGESQSSAAAYFLRDQREVDRLLARLIALRERAARP
jgi:trehalose 6-phosphate phosphatase